MDQTKPKYDYDVAISYAGEDRHIAEAIANTLRRGGVKVFYDAYEKHKMWGKGRREGTTVNM